MSSTGISGTAATTYAAHRHLIEAVSGALHLRITSAFSGARNPGDERVVFPITPEREGLLALRGLIDSEVEA